MFEYGGGRMDTQLLYLLRSWTLRTSDPPSDLRCTLRSALLYRVLAAAQISKIKKKKLILENEEGEMALPAG